MLKRFHKLLGLGLLMGCSISCAFDAETFSYQDLETHIRDKKIGSIDELLDSFEQSSVLKQFFENATFAYVSKSSQRRDVSEKYPRIVMYLGNVVLAMTGRSPQNGGDKNVYENLEVVTTDNESGAFNLNRIHFIKTGDGKFQPNEETCKDCHGETVRPIWLTYANWPGFFGSHDDLINEKVPKERQVWKEFVKGTGKEGRYKHFDLASMYEVDHIVGMRANLGLNNLLVKMNSLRIGKLLSETEKLGEYRYAVWAAVLNCPEYKSYFPEELYKSHEKHLGMTAQELYSDTIKKIKDRIELKHENEHELAGYTEHKSKKSFELPIKEGGLTVGDDHFESLVKLRLVMEGKVERDLPPLAQFTMDYLPGRHSGSYNLHQLGFNLSDGQFLKRLFAEIGAHEPDLKTSLANGLYVHSTGKMTVNGKKITLCEYLLDKSKEALAGKGIVDSPTSGRDEKKH